GQLLVRAVEPPELYDAIIEVLQRRLGAMLVMIGEADHAAGWFQRVAPVAVTADMQDIYPEQTPLSLVRPSFWRGVPQIEPDLRRVPGLQRLRTAYERHDVVAAMAIPVMVFGEVRAGLVIRASDPAYFSTRLTELLQQAAASIGLGLEAQSQRHQLQRSVQQEARQRRALRLLSEMIKVVTHSPDETLLLAESSDVACRVGGYRFAWIGLFAGDAAVVALRRGEPCVRQYAAGAPREWPLPGTTLGDGAVLALPLRVGEAVVGVFVVGADQADAFTPVEVQVFAEMAVELGLGMQMQRAHAARLLAERDLRFNLQHVRTVLSNQHSGVLVTTANGLVKFANEAFCALFGLAESPGELEGLPSAALHARISHLYCEPERELERTAGIVARNEESRDEEVLLADGRVLLRDFMPICIDGVAQGCIWQQRDITERKLHEA